MTKTPRHPSSAQHSNPNFILAKVASDRAESAKSRKQQACTPVDFAERALAHVGPDSRFGVLAVAMEPTGQPGGSASDPANPTLWFDRICSRENGIWGPLGDRSWALFMPGKTADESRQLAREVRSCAVEANRTVIIGIAVYPTLDYAREDILANACKACEHARFFGPDSQALFDAVSLNISADSHYDAGDLDAAEAEFRQALRLDPDDANLHNSLGVCHADRGDFVKALARFQRALALKKEDPLAAYNIAMVHRLSGETDPALEYFSIAERSPDARFASKLQIGRIYLENHAPEQAVSHLEEAAELQPEFGSVHSLLGECYDALGLQDAARAAFKKSLRANANDAAALSGLGWIYHRQKENSDIATLFCRQSVEIAPENGIYRYRLARRYLAENRLKEAQRQFEKAAGLGCDTGEYPEIVRSRLLDKAS